MIISKKMSAAPFYSIVVLIVGWLFTVDDGAKRANRIVSGLSILCCSVSYFV